LKNIPKKKLKFNIRGASLQARP